MWQRLFVTRSDSHIVVWREEDGHQMQHEIHADGMPEDVQQDRVQAHDQRRISGTRVCIHFQSGS